MESESQALLHVWSDQSVQLIVGAWSMPVILWQQYEYYYYLKTAYAVYITLFYSH